jgi:hypothetical protein
LLHRLAGGCHAGIVSDEELAAPHRQPPHGVGDVEDVHESAAVVDDM